MIRIFIFKEKTIIGYTEPDFEKDPLAQIEPIYQELDELKIANTDNNEVAESFLKNGAWEMPQEEVIRIFGDKAYLASNGNCIITQLEQGYKVEFIQIKIEDIRSQKLQELTSFFNEQEKTAQLESSLGFPIDANEKANRNIDGLIEAVEGQKLEDPIGFCDKNNQIQQVTLDNLKTMKLEIILNGQFLYQKKWAVRNQINSIQDPEELEQFNIETSFAKALSE